MSSESKRNVKVKRAGKLGKVQSGGASLGRAIVRQQFPTAQPTAKPGALETEIGKQKLRSITQCDDLEELMSHAVLAGTDFASRRGETLILSSHARTETAKVRAPDDVRVPIPRRPAWHAGQPADELAANERAAFLEWRRGMANLEEHRGYLLTPFEKNLEV